MRICWLTDLHLNRYPTFLNKRLIEKSQPYDALLATGDITTGFKTEEHIELLKRFSSRVYFVLGNHDFYGSSFSDVETRVKQVCRDGRATWLDQSPPILLGRSTYLVGVGGWYDAMYGDTLFLDVNFDRMMIRDLLLKTRREERRDLIQARAEASVENFKRKMAQIPYQAEKVIVATHFPPWIGPMKSILDAFWLPQSVNSVLGDEILEQARLRGPITKFEVVCGHVHKEFEMNPAPNVKCTVSDARDAKIIVV